MKSIQVSWWHVPRNFLFLKLYTNTTFTMYSFIFYINGCLYKQQVVCLLFIPEWFISRQKKISPYICLHILYCLYKVKICKISFTKWMRWMYNAYNDSPQEISPTGNFTPGNFFPLRKCHPGKIYHREIYPQEISHPITFVPRNCHPSETSSWVKFTLIGKFTLRNFHS